MTKTTLSPILCRIHGA